MATCTKCGSEGADVFLYSVFCPNKDCPLYDEVVHNRIKDAAKSSLNRFIRDMKQLNIDYEEKTDPDKTPVVPFSQYDPSRAQ